VLAFSLAACPQALASAGGGVGGIGVGGGGTGGGAGGGFPPWQFFALVGALIATCWLSVRGYVFWKCARGTRQLERLSTVRDAWEPFAVEQRVRRAFCEVQEAWEHRDPDRARDYMSARLYGEHAALIEEMREHHRVNVMKDLQYGKGAVVGLRATIDPAGDRMWVWFEAKLIDYITDEAHDLLIEGSAEPRQLREVWEFVPGPSGWVVDRIHQRLAGAHFLLARFAIQRGVGA
jgi:hypothetical protein